MSIILIGSNGQLGQEFLANQAHFPKFIPLKRGDFDIKKDSDLLELFASYNPTHIINCAAYTAVDKAESERKEAANGNVELPMALGRAAKLLNIPFIHFSTDYVFDGEKQGAYYTEDDQTNPTGEYGRSKLRGEQLITFLFKKYFILRTSWVYSEYGNNFLKTMLRLAKERDELRVVADQIGCPTHTKDIVMGVKSLLNSESYGIYNLAGAKATSWHGFASHIIEEAAKITGKKPLVTPITTAEFPTPAKRPANSMLSNEKFIKTFGYTPLSFEERVSETVEALLK
jgi:dTDP-4-dehydrorhamnose reductase